MNSAVAACYYRSVAACVYICILLQVSCCMCIHIYILLQVSCCMCILLQVSCCMCIHIYYYRSVAACVYYCRSVAACYTYVYYCRSVAACYTYVYYYRSVAACVYYCRSVAACYTYVYYYRSVAACYTYVYYCRSVAACYTYVYYYRSVAACYTYVYYCRSVAAYVYYCRSVAAYVYYCRSVAACYICIYIIAGNRLHLYSNVLDSSNPFKFRPLPSCPQFHWAVPRPLNSSAMRGLFSLYRRGPSSFLEGFSDGPNRNLKAHGGLEVIGEAQGQDFSNYMLIGVCGLGVAGIWLLCRHRRLRPRGRRMLFGKLPVVFPSSI